MNKIFAHIPAPREYRYSKNNLHKNDLHEVPPNHQQVSNAGAYEMKI